MSKKILLLMAYSAVTVAFGSSIEGKWKTIDDKTHQAKSIVEITQLGNTYVGTIIELLPGATATICSKCTGADKDKPIEGLTILTGLQQINDIEYDNGKILDPKTGKTYSGSAKLINGGQSLELRGYVGIKLFGRSQTWQRVE